MPRSRRRILAVGDAIVDLVTPPIAPLAAEDFQGEVSRISLLPGGNATNFALQAASLGLPTSLVACVGRDAFAGVLRDAYRSKKVRAVLRTDASKPTGATVALTWTNGARALLTSVGANAGLAERDVPASILASAGHVHRAGFWWTPGLLGPPSVRLLRRAKRSGATTSLDVSTDPQGWRLQRVAAVRACLPHVDTFFGNEEEVCAIAGLRDPFDAAVELTRHGAAEVVLHLGPRGSAWIARGKVVEAPALRVPIDNPTGCGDVFNAGYVFARMSGASVEEALGMGNACAALHLADRSHPYPTLRDIDRFLRGG